MARWGTLAVVSVVLVACGSGDGGSEAGDDTGSEVVGIGPEGGELELPSGARLVVPAGALSETVEITMTERTAPWQVGQGFAPAGTFWDLAPIGTYLDPPATVVLPVALPAEWASLEDALFVAWVAVDGTWAALPTTVDAATGALVAEVSVLTAGGPAVPGEVCATAESCYAPTCITAECLQGLCFSGPSEAGAACEPSSPCKALGVCDGFGVCEAEPKCPDGCCIGGECFDGKTEAACGVGGESCQTCGSGEPCIGGVCAPCWSACDGCCVGGEVCVAADEVSGDACGSGASGCVSCDADESCEAGVCTSPQACIGDDDCDAAGVCRAAVCDLASGKCTYPFDVTATCDDGDPCTDEDFCSAFDGACKGVLDPTCTEGGPDCGACADESRAWAGDPVGQVAVLLDVPTHGCSLIPGGHPAAVLTVEEGGEVATVGNGWTLTAHDAGELVEQEGWRFWTGLPVDEATTATFVHDETGVTVEVTLTVTEAALTLGEVCWGVDAGG